LYNSQGGIAQVVLSAKNGASPYTTKYGYTQNHLTSRIDGFGDADATTTAFEYEPDTGLLKKLTTTGTAWGAGLVTEYTYDLAGRPKTRKDPAQFTATRSYDPAGRLYQQVVCRGSPTCTNVATFSYVLDPVGNVQGERKEVNRRRRAA